MSHDRSEALHARAKAFVGAFEQGAEMPEAFDALASDIARFQADTSVGFRRLCEARRVNLARLGVANEIPAVPTDAFRLTRVATFEEPETAVTFRTSGTTSGARGEHPMRDVSTYDRGALAFGRRWLARDEAKLPVVCLMPPPSAMTDSSLVHMSAAFVDAFGEANDPAKTWLIDGDVIDVSAFDERVAHALAANRPMLVLATSFALVHFLDALGDDTFALPKGSRVMQTGGFKGKSREVSADELRRELTRVFNIPARAIVAEYGMTELSSQFYERTMFEPDSPHGVFAEPPWARVVPVDPESLAPVPDGQIGLAKIIDLANVDSAVAVLTQDRVRRVGGENGGFELLGRAPGAPSRGCSIAVDELLGGN